MRHDVTKRNRRPVGKTRVREAAKRIARTAAKLKSLATVKAVVTLLLVVGSLSLCHAQRVNYSAPRFSASFNGAVKTWAKESDVKTSTNDYYSSETSGITELIAVRIIEHDIAVDNTSLDFYIGQTIKNGGTVVRSVYSTVQGHPAVTALIHKDDDSQRWMYIMLDARTVLVLAQTTSWSTGDQTEWDAFVNSLVIK
jgi:hypothetical protein